MKRIIIFMLLLLMCFPSNVYAANDFQATWDSKTNTIQLTWDPLPEEGEYWLYCNYGDGWVKKEKINNETSKTISDYLQNTEHQYQICEVKDGKKVNDIALSNKVLTGEKNFTTSVKWTGEDIEIEWNHATKSLLYGTDIKIWLSVNSGESQILFEHDQRESATVRVSEYGFIPQEGEQWVFTIWDGKDHVDRSIFCGEPGMPGTEDSGDPENEDQGGIPQSIPIFQANSWIIVMFWYKVLASLSGIFVFFTIIRCGYQYMHTNNSGIRASVIDTLQKCVIALIFIMLVPTFIDLLIQINDTIVKLCLDTLNALTQDVSLDSGVIPIDTIAETDWLASVFAAPFKIILEAVEKLFGLHNLGNIIFNTAPESTILSNNIFYGGGLDSWNPLTQALVGLAFMAFTLYYNAVYLLRRWVIIAVTAIAPIIIWIWTLSENKTIMQVWLAEVFQTIFMQTFHALTFGVVFSVLCFSGNIPSLIPTGDIATSLISIGKFVAWFGGIFCAGSIIFNSFRLIVTTSDQVREEVRTNLSRSIIGLIIIGLSLLIAGALTEANLIIPIPNEATDTGKITIFQLFIAMVAVIPISKMLSTIFMNLISRIGTVDEDRWAGKSLGMVGGLFGLGAAAGRATKSIGVPNPKNLAGESSDIKPKTPSNISAADNLSYHADPYGIKNTLSGAPVTVSSSTGHYGSMLRPHDIGQSGGDWVYNHDTGRIQDFDSFNKGRDDYLEPPPMTLPQGIPVPPSVDSGWSDTIYNKDEDKFYDAQTGEEVGGILSPELNDWIDGGCIDPAEQRALEKSQQESNFMDTVKVAAQNETAYKAGKKTGIIGDSIAPGTSGFFEGITKSAGVMTATISAFNTGTDLMSRSGIRPEINTSHIQEFTGRDTTLGGLTQMGAATILSPLGPNIAGKASTKLGGGIDTIASRKFS